MTMKLLKPVLLCLLLAANLAACGLKGPLYLPDGDEPAVEVEPAADSEDEEHDGAAA
jgi:predicted small lipoprotein YifL